MVEPRLILLGALLLQTAVAQGAAQRQQPPWRKVRGLNRQSPSVLRRESRRRLMMDTPEPSSSPTVSPTTAAPTVSPTDAPTAAPTGEPKNDKDKDDDREDTEEPTPAPFSPITPGPIVLETTAPMVAPTTWETTAAPVASPVTNSPTWEPSPGPVTSPVTSSPTWLPTATTDMPSSFPSTVPTTEPSSAPSGAPTRSPTRAPSQAPSAAPSPRPSARPSAAPSAQPSSVPSAAPSAAPSASPKMDLADFHILLTKGEGDQINLGAVTATLDMYLTEGMGTKFVNLQHIDLNLLEGDSGYDSNGRMSSSLRYGGVASFQGHGTEPAETVLNEQQGLLLTAQDSLAAVQAAVSQNPALQGVAVHAVSFEGLDACEPFPTDCNGEKAEADSSTTLVLVTSLGGVSLCVMAVATLILRRHINGRERAASEEAERAKEPQKGNNDETSLPSAPPDDEEGITPGCASLVGSAAIDFGVDGEANDDNNNNTSAALSPLTQEGTPYSSERPQEISIKQDSDDELDLDYLTVDEDLHSTAGMTQEPSLSPYMLE